MGCNSSYEINLEHREKDLEGIGWELIVSREFNWETKWKYWRLRLNLDKG